MIPIFQTIVDPDEGNCLPACLASLLHISLDSIPHFLKLYGRRSMMQEARRWLAATYGMTLLTIEARRESIPLYAFARSLHVDTLCLISGQSQTFEDGTHVVVGKIINDIFDYELIHDPNPCGLGIKGQPLYYYFFVAIDPSKISLMAN